MTGEDEILEEVLKPFGKPFGRPFQSSAKDLKLYQSSLEEAPLEGKFGVVVHELLGHVASSEGAVETMAHFLTRDLCTADCIFLPHAAGTFFAPTSRLQLSDLEEVLSACFNGELGVRPEMKYHARCFDTSYHMAPAQAFEWLDFKDATSLQSCRRRRVTFVTSSGHFDGLHFFLVVDLSPAHIDTSQQDTTWSTTYVKLFEEPLWLSENSRLVCDCEAQNVEGTMCYSVKVSLGEPWDEREVASFSWAGCT